MVDINWYFDQYLNRNFHLNDFFNLNWSIYINRLFNVNRFFNEVGYLNSSDDFPCFNRGHFFLDLYVFWYFHHFLHNTFRARYIFGYLNLHLNRFLDNNFFDSLLCSLNTNFLNFTVSFLQLSLKGIQVYFQFVLLSL